MNACLATRQRAVEVVREGWYRMAGRVCDEAFRTLTVSIVSQGVGGQTLSSSVGRMISGTAMLWVRIHPELQGGLLDPEPCHLAPETVQRRASIP